MYLPNVECIENDFLQNSTSIEVLVLPPNLETNLQIQSTEKKDINKNKYKTLTLSYTNSH